MKDLRLNKESVSTLQDDQLEGIVGGAGDITNSCKRKSCGDGNGDIEVDV